MTSDPAYAQDAMSAEQPTWAGTPQASAMSYAAAEWQEAVGQPCGQGAPTVADGATGPVETDRDGAPPVAARPEVVPAMPAASARAPSPPLSRVKPDLPGDEPQDATGALCDRLAHAKWDVRAHALQQVACAIFQLARQCGGQACIADWEEHTASVGKGLGESNVAVLDKALNAAQQLLYYAPIPLCEQLASSCAEVPMPP